MSNLKLPAIQSYEDAAKLYESTRYPHNVAYKTRLTERNGGIAILHHDSPIITYYPDGTIELDHWGWHSTTTSNRMNRLTPEWLCVNIRQGDIHVNGNYLPRGGQTFKRD